MSLPRDSYKENLFSYISEGGDMLFSERSKSQEHTDRFGNYEEAQKIKKTEEN